MTGKVRMKRLVKTGVIASVLTLGVYASAVMPEAVQSFLPRVETLSAAQLDYSPTVTASGSVGKDGTVWYAVVMVSEGDINDVAVGQQAVFSGAALENGAFFGEVSEIGDSAYQKQRGSSTETVVNVTITITNGDEKLRSGYTVQADIKTAPTEKILLLPYSVICQDEKGEYVYILKKSVAERKDIITGRELSDGAEIISGIAPSDEIIAAPESVNPDSYVLKREKQ